MDRASATSPPCDARTHATVPFSRRALDRSVAHARRAAPAECCGVLLSRNTEIVRTVALRNVAGLTDRFEADPLDLMRVEQAARGQGLSLAGYYHSHVDSPLIPSVADRRSVLWPGLTPCLHLIVSPCGGCRLFRITTEGWVESRIRIIR